MIHVRCFVFLAISHLSCSAIKVNMRGSLSFGKEVMDTISYFLSENQLSGRRAIPSKVSFKEPKGSLSSIVKSANLCTNLQFCQGTMEKLINEYIISLTRAIDNLFNDIIYPSNDNKHSSNEAPKKFFFENELKRSLKGVKRILKGANKKITDDKHVYVWINVGKKISAQFQEKALSFIIERLKGNSEEIHDIKKKLSQNVVFAIVSVEAKFEVKLCSEHNICIKSYECTKSVNSLLDQFRNMMDEKIREFVKSFSAALDKTPFYSGLNDGTAKEFQTILNEIATDDNVAIKDIFVSIKNIVADRLRQIETNSDEQRIIDVQLVHVILSDMDHFFSRGKKRPFEEFLFEFTKWINSHHKIDKSMQNVMKIICNQLSTQSEQLLLKIYNEVRCFLELAVGNNK